MDRPGLKESTKTACVLAWHEIFAKKTSKNPPVKARPVKPWIQHMPAEILRMIVDEVSFTSSEFEAVTPLIGIDLTAK